MAGKVKPPGIVDRSEKRKRGKALRQQAPRSSHGAWSPAADRPDPIAQLQAEDKSRLQQLVPIKYGRMLTSPFAFLRGSARAKQGSTNRLNATEERHDQNGSRRRLRRNGGLRTSSDRC